MHSSYAPASSVTVTDSEASSAPPWAELAPTAPAQPPLPLGTHTTTSPSSRGCSPVKVTSVGVSCVRWTFESGDAAPAPSLTSTRMCGGGAGGGDGDGDGVGGGAAARGPRGVVGGGAKRRRTGKAQLGQGARQTAAGRP